MKTNLMVALSAVALAALVAAPAVAKSRTQQQSAPQTYSNNTRVRRGSRARHRSGPAHPFRDPARRQPGLQRQLSRSTAFAPRRAPASPGLFAFLRPPHPVLRNCFSPDDRVNCRPAGSMPSSLERFPAHEKDRSGEPCFAPSRHSIGSARRTRSPCWRARRGSPRKAATSSISASASLISAPPITSSKRR